MTAGLGMLEIGARQLNNWRPHEPPRLPSLLPAMGPAQHAYIIACCHVITSDHQGGTQTKKDLQGECAVGVEIYQQKNASSFTQKYLSPQGVATEGTVVAVTQKVNVACEAIQNSLTDLVEVVESFSHLSAKPKLNEAQSRGTGSHAHLCTYVDCVSKSGKTIEGVCDSEQDEGQMSTSEIKRVVQPASEGKKGFSSPQSSPKDSCTNPTNPLKIIEVECNGGNMGKLKSDIGNGREDSTTSNECQTPERVCYLRSLWEQGARTVQRRWRSKGAWVLYTMGIDIRPGQSQIPMLCLIMKLLSAIIVLGKIVSNLNQPEFGT